MPWKMVALLLGGGLWAGAVGTGLFQLADHAGTPGQAAPAQPQLPAGTQLRARSSGPTLILFAHPHCPCTRTSLDALAQLLDRAPEPRRVYVVFWAPAGDTGTWAHTDSWERAARIPGVVVRADPGGREARLFGAVTSGQVFAYDRTGRLRFAGGLTPARGHAGTSKGARALRAVLTGEEPDVSIAPVFGCPLFGE